jgi:hypothetical protein
VNAPASASAYAYASASVTDRVVPVPARNVELRRFEGYLKTVEEVKKVV